MYSYALTPHEEAYALEVGYQRQKPYFGNPTKNVNYSEGDIWEMWQHAVCAGAELAFARMTGDSTFYPHYNKWKSELDIPGFGEIRYSFNPNNGMRYTVRDGDELIYVLVTNGLCHKTRRVAPDWKGQSTQQLAGCMGLSASKMLGSTIKQLGMYLKLTYAQWIR
jgi:hypothetical protein